MLPHIKKCAKTCFYQLRQLWSIRRSITTTVAKSLAQAFVCSHIDYCNSALFGCASTHLRILQSVLNAAARLVTKRRKFDHITDALRDLHWLPIAARVDFKLCLVTYKCLHNIAPTYLSQLCIPLGSNPGRSHLRSASRGDLFVPPCRTVTFGARNFAVAAPKLWNELPPTVRDTNLTLSQFKSALKTHLFSVVYDC